MQRRTDAAAQVVIHPGRILLEIAEALHAQAGGFPANHGVRAQHIPCQRLYFRIQGIVVIYGAVAGLNPHLRITAHALGNACGQLGNAFLQHVPRLFRKGTQCTRRAAPRRK